RPAPRREPDRRRTDAAICERQVAEDRFRLATRAHLPCQHRCVGIHYFRRKRRYSPRRHRAIVATRAAGIGGSVRRHLRSSEYVLDQQGRFPAARYRYVGKHEAENLAWSENVVIRYGALAVFSDQRSATNGVSC